MSDIEDERLTWHPLQRRIREKYAKAPSYYVWLRLVDRLNIPYYYDSITNRRTYSWTVVDEIYAKREQKITRKT